MNDRDILREERLVRVQGYGSDNTGDFAVGSKAKVIFARIDQRLLDLGQAKIGQVPGRILKSTLIDALWLDFKAIAGTARRIGAALLGRPVADYALPEQRTEANVKTQALKLLSLLEDNAAPLADGGDTPAQKAAKAALRAEFISWEMAPDFVIDLRADYDALLTANQHNQTENAEGLEDTAAIDRILFAASEDVTDLQTIMRNKYARDPAKLHAWESISRVHRSPTRAKKVEATGDASSNPQKP